MERCRFAGTAGHRQSTTLRLGQFQPRARRLWHFRSKSLGFLSIWAIFAGIKAKDGARFDRAFEKFTSACNSCHKAVGLGFIDMREPLRSPIMTSPFSNQSFEPK